MYNLNNLTYLDPYFKPSKFKMEQRYQFIPTNLHLQGIAVLDPYDNGTLFILIFSPIIKVL